MTRDLAGFQILGAQSGLTSRRNLQPAFRLSVTRKLITGKRRKHKSRFAEAIFPNTKRFSQLQRQKDGINCLNKTPKQSADKISGYELRRGFSVQELSLLSWHLRLLERQPFSKRKTILAASKPKGRHQLPEQDAQAKS